jgi:3-hydroxybutyryl-CoA dehydratase
MDTQRREFRHEGDVVTQGTIDAYAEMSSDFNPLHVDVEAAAASEFGGIIAHGPISLQPFFRAATEWLGVEHLAPGSSVRVTYRHPVRPGDQIGCQAQTVTGDESDGFTVEAECRNGDGTTVVSVVATLTT